MVDLEIFAGRITSTGFSSGDRIVIGDWHDSPIGSFTNIMWAKPDGTRVLLSPSEEHAKYVSNYTTSRVWRLPILPSKGLEEGYLSKEGPFRGYLLGDSPSHPHLEAIVVHRNYRGILQGCFLAQRHMAEPRTTEESGTRLDRSQEF